MWIEHLLPDVLIMDRVLNYRRKGIWKDLLSETRMNIAAWFFLTCGNKNEKIDVCK